jgi:hypothetical protein
MHRLRKCKLRMPNHEPEPQHAHRSSKET